MFSNLQNPKKAIKQLADYVGRDVSEKEIEDVMKQTTLNSMKERFVNHRHDEVLEEGKTSQVLIRKGMSTIIRMFVLRSLPGVGRGLINHESFFLTMVLCAHPIIKLFSKYV